jgi:uncharacterized protein YcbK (DUF882 family)
MSAGDRIRADDPQPARGTLSMETKTAGTLPCNRRYFLGLGLVVAGAALSPAARAAVTAPRRLAFHHTHTGETLSTTYWSNGGYVPDSLTAIDHILRDFVNGERHIIDRRLLDLLASLHRNLGSRAPFEIISAYRSPATNAMLRAKSDGVAKNSYHLKAMAIDVRLADVPLSQLRAAAMDLKRGGVGIYPASNFVHVDTGPVRYW